MVGGGGGGLRGAFGEGVRLWLFIYCYIDTKLKQQSKIKNEIDQVCSLILIPST